MSIDTKLHAPAGAIAALEGVYPGMNYSYAIGCTAEEASKPEALFWLIPRQEDFEEQKHQQAFSAADIFCDADGPVRFTDGIRMVYIWQDAEGRHAQFLTLEEWDKASIAHTSTVDDFFLKYTKV